MPKQNSVRWTGTVRLDVRSGRFVKYTNNIINSAENYAWYLDSALGEINSTRICAFPIEAYWTFYFEEATRHPAGGRSRGTTLVWLCGRWPHLVGGLWWEVSYTVTQLMHSVCGRICREAVGEGGLITGGPLYLNVESTFTSCKLFHENSRLADC